MYLEFILILNASLDKYLVYMIFYVDCKFIVIYYQSGQVYL